MKSLYQKLTLALFCLLLAAFDGKSQVHPGDSSVLVEFYYLTNGPNWNDDTNWLITPVKDWLGIELDLNNYRVVGIQLINDNLSGSLPEIICNLDSLKYLILSNNNLSGALPNCIGSIPLHTIDIISNNFTGTLPLSLGTPNNSLAGLFVIVNNHFEGTIPETILNSGRFYNIVIFNNNFNKIEWPSNPIVNEFQIHKNNFTFDDILPILANPPWNEFIFSPQDSVLDLMDTTIAPGSNLTLDALVDTCSGNLYSWKKNTTWLNWQSQNSTWEITNAQTSQSGYYTCLITNPNCWALSLHRRMIHVLVDNTPGLENEFMGKEYRINYNTVNHMLYISLDFSTPKTVKSAIYDGSGRKFMNLYQGTTLQQEFYHSLEQVKPGIYLVILKIGDELVSKKIMIQ